MRRVKKMLCLKGVTITKTCKTGAGNMILEKEAPVMVWADLYLCDRLRPRAL